MIQMCGKSADSTEPMAANDTGFHLLDVDV
jgi:hypothetical protein